MKKKKNLISCAVQVLLLTIVFALLPLKNAHSLPETNPAKYVAPTQADVPEYKGGAIVLPPEAAESQVPSEPGAGNVYTLAELVDFALQSSPVTRLAWAQAMASAAQWGQAHSAYYPTVSAEGQGATGKIPQLQGGKSYVSMNTTLSYLLLDFGARGAKSEAARQALIAANWNHNQAIQDILRNVPQAYYTYTANKAQVRADEQSLKEAVTTVLSTEERMRSGVSTISDVLQARSNADQVRLKLASDTGQVAISKGNLATAIGWPANKQFDVAEGPGRLPIKEVGRNVDDLVELARVSRPALGAAVHAVSQAEAGLKQAKALPFPQLTGTGNFQWLATKDEHGNFEYGGMGIS
ncbi:MAG: TolC family protein, partial [bacterium]